MLQISILGDSISNYQGYNPSGYDVFYIGSMLSKNGLKSVEDTWWMQVIRYLGGRLVINNSYSGSRVSGKGFPAASCEERILRLRSENVVPDLILIYIGFNDFGYGVKVKNNKLFGSDLLCFEDAYDHMLIQLKKSYPKAEIICGTLMRGFIMDEEDWKFPEHFGGIAFNEYNDMIRHICKKNHCQLADLEKLGYRYETLDGTHATARGHETIAKAWMECLQAIVENR